MGSVNDHLASVARQLGKEVAEPEGPVFPEPLRYLWMAFLELMPRRTSGMSANPLTYTELAAWSRLTRTPVVPWECRLLMRLDDALMVVLRPKPKPPKGKK